MITSGALSRPRRGERLRAPPPKSRHPQRHPSDPNPNPNPNSDPNPSPNSDPNPNPNPNPHQVRRLLNNCGHPVTALHRVRYGDVHLDDLEEGGSVAVEAGWV